jgi:predicted NACHT family NTPase
LWQLFYVPGILLVFGPRDSPENRRDARSTLSLAEKLSAEVQREEREERISRDDVPSSRKDATFNLGTVLAQKTRFAIIGGPGVGKTTTLKWLAITSTLPGEEGQRLRLAFGLPPAPLIPIYVRFRQFAERIGYSNSRSECVQMELTAGSTNSSRGLRKDSRDGWFNK